MDTKSSLMYTLVRFLRFPMLIIHGYPKEQSAKNGNGNTGLKQSHSNFNIIKTHAKIFQVFLVETKGGFILKINYGFASLNKKLTLSVLVFYMHF